MNTLLNKYKPLYAGVVLLTTVLLSVGLPKVPHFLVKLLNNTVFKVLYMGFILMLFNYDPLMAFVLALIFLLLLQTITNYNQYLDTTKDSLNLGNLTTGLVNAAGDSVNEVVNDAGSILTSLADAVSDTHSYLTQENFEENFEAQNETFNNPPEYYDFSYEKTENFESLSPGDYDNLKDLYNGPMFKHSLVNTTYEPNPTIDNLVPQPLKNDFNNESTEEKYARYEHAAPKVKKNETKVKKA